MRFGIAFNFCNYADWERFLALERGEDVEPMAVDDHTILSEQFALADLAEPLGFDSLWTFEMHGAPGLMTPDPTQYLTYFAGRTKRIDFGSMITVLPWHNPVRLAEQIAMLQHFLGRGRKYYLGVGRGLALRNFEAMGISMDEARERFVEVLEVLRLAFTEEIFSYHGQFFDFENVSMRPRPLDPSTVLEAWGSWTSEQSVRVMGANGLHPLTSTNKTVESYLQDLELLDEVRAQHGHGPAERPILQLPFYCCESEQEAREGAERYFTEWVDSIMKLYEIGTERFGSAKGYEQYTTSGSDFGGGSYEDAVKTLSEKFQEVGLVGTPEQCAEKVMWHRESMNPQEIVVVSGPGDQRGDAAERSMRLYAERVLPRLEEIRSRPQPAAGLVG
jgi:alkanesulfonate monooxygenase SsuD/methylene tetrahydromethanopterin reductase-like flavin-dependent oxidoreductase (luciferase family)